jgi:hypothetical protein
MLAALRGAVKECWRLGMMAHHAYLRTADIAAVQVDIPFILMDIKRVRDHYYGR